MFGPTKRQWCIAAALCVLMGLAAQRSIAEGRAVEMAEFLG